VTLDGRPVKLRTLGELVWIMLYKPKGVISSVEDPLGRKTLMDLVPFAKEQRLVPVGRIDSHGSGLILLTNDYEWHSILTHPRYEHARRFNIQVYGGNPDRTKIVALQKGLELPDEARTCLPLKDIEVSKSKKHEGVHHISFTMHEGRYRQIQRMFEYIGHPVKSMKRTGFGLVPLDKKLKPGDWRLLTTKEIRRLKGPTILARPKKPPQEVEKELETSAHDSRAMERERHLHAFEKADAGDPGWKGADGAGISLRTILTIAPPRALKRRAVAVLCSESRKMLPKEERK